MQQEPQPLIEPVWGVKPKSISQMVNIDVLEQHLDEAEFLWMQHQNMVQRPDIQFDDLFDMDEYLQGNLDGLALGGETAWSLCEELLENSSDEIFAATYLALIHNRLDRIDKILEKVDEDNEASFIGALSWLEYDKAESFIIILLEHEKAYFNYIGVSACIFHRQMPVNINLLSLLNSEVTLLKQSVIRLIGTLKLQSYRNHLHLYLIYAEPSLRFETARALALMGERATTIPVLLALASTDFEYQPEVLQIVLRICDEATQRQLIDSFILSEDLAIAIQAIGIVGFADYVPWLIKKMACPEFARLAGEAFSFITGADLDYLDLVIEESDEENEPENEDDNEQDSADSADGNEDIALFNEDESDEFDGKDEENENEQITDDYQEDLVTPDPILVAQWWQQYHRDYPNGTRYLAGSPINEGNLLAVYKTGFQRQRIAAVLELALLDLDGIWLNTAQPAYRQLNTVFKAVWQK